MTLSSLVKTVTTHDFVGLVGLVMKLKKFVTTSSIYVLRMRSCAIIPSTLSLSSANKVHFTFSNYRFE